MSVQDFGIAGAAAVCSPSLWKDCPMGAIIKDPSRYLHIWEDFVEGVIANDLWPTTNFNMVGTNPDCGVYAEINGVFYLQSSGADGDDAYLKSNVLYDLTMNNNKRFWLETRVKVLDEDLDMAFIAGLMEPTGCVTGGIAAGGLDVIDEDFIGFLAVTDATNMGNIQAVYNQGGDGAHTDVVASVHSPADLVYVKLGMRFDGKKTVTFYADGASVGTLNLDDLANNSLANPLCFFMGITDGVGSANVSIKIDWIRFACEKFAGGM